MQRSFQAKYARHFLADLRKLEPAIQSRILAAIERKLLVDPFRHGKKLVAKTRPGRWRFRVGDYRVRFDIEGRVLIFYRVGHRREIYE